MELIFFLTSLASYSTGYGNYTVSRPMFYDLILKQVPPHKIFVGHRVLNITEEDDKAVVHLSDNSTFAGDIVVGADGAYSVVRQRMYEKLRTKGELPKPDQEDLPFSCTCLIGQTGVVNPEKFPMIALPHCLFNSVHGQDKPFSVGLHSNHS
jgi:2-polyprenyl-6-methoxyphenol hydroxylase-like FAD-dependent oxidoreductase